MKQIKLSNKAALIAASLLLTAGASLHATLLTSDSFDYPSGDNLDGKNGGTGWAVAWGNQNSAFPTLSDITVQSPGLSYSTLVVGGNQVTTNSFDSTGRRLDNSPGGVWDSAGYMSDPYSTSQIDQGNVWGSFLARRNAATASWDDGPLFSLHRDFTGWAANNSNSALRIGWDATGGTWYARQGSSVTNLSSSGLGDTVLFVFKLELSTTGANNIYVWQNPTGLGGSDLATSTADASFTGLGTSDARFRSFAAYGGGSASNATSFDEVRLGTSYASVTPIPEPAASALALVGGIAVLFSRRRRARN